MAGTATKAKPAASKAKSSKAKNDAAQAAMRSTPQAKKEPDALPAFPNKDGSTRVATRAAYHAVDGKPEGSLAFLGLYEFPTHTQAIEKARKAHKLGDDAVIVTLNARHAVVSRNAPREGDGSPAAAGGAGESGGSAA